MANKNKRQYGGKFVAAISNPMLAPHNRQQFITLIEPGVTYQVIPSITKFYQDSPWLTVVDLLPYSDGTLLDVSLPFEHKNGRGDWIKHQARYFILNRRVIGIKIKTGKIWKRHYCQKFQLPHKVYSAYKNSNKTSVIDPRQCLIGEFYIALQNMKIAPLFETQIQTNKDMINEYQRFGCEIFSVFDNRLRQNTPQRNELVESKFLGTNTILIYTGVKTGIYFSQTCWTNAVYKQGKQVSRICENPFSKGHTMNKILNLKLSRQTKKYLTANQINQMDDDECEISQADNRPILAQVNCRTEKIQQASSEALKKISKPLPEFKMSNQIPLYVLYIWYLLNQVNNGEPFTIQVPLGEKTLALLFIIKQLKQTLKKTKVNFERKIFQLYTDNSDVEYEWPSQLNLKPESQPLIKNQLMRKLDRGQSIHVYCEGEQEIKYWIQKAKKYKTIFQSSILLTQKFHQIRIPGHLQLSEQNQTMQRALEKLCQEIISKKYNTISEMIQNFLIKNQNSQELTEAFTNIIPRKLKSKYALHPPFVTLLSMPLQAIQYTLEEFETVHRMNSFGGQGDQRQTKQKQISLDSKVKQAKIWKQKNSSVLTCCHSCEQVIARKYTISCKTCKKPFCIQCLARYNAVLNTNYEQFRQNLDSKCPYCKKSCKCTSCTDLRKLKQQMEREQRQRIRERVKQTDFYGPKKISSNSCAICSLAGGDRMEITIQCSNCENQTCWECYKNSKATRPNPLDPWLCKTCDKKMNPDINAQKKQTLFQQQQLLTLSYFETPQGIRKREEQQRLAKEMASFIPQNNPRQDLIQSQNIFDRAEPPQRDSPQSSPSRSRNKKKFNAKRSDSRQNGNDKFSTRFAQFKDNQQEQDDGREKRGFQGDGFEKRQRGSRERNRDNDEDRKFRGWNKDNGERDNSMGSQQNDQGRFQSSFRRGQDSSERFDQDEGSGGFRSKKGSFGDRGGFGADRGNRGGGWGGRGRDNNDRGRDGDDRGRGRGRGDRGGRGRGRFGGDNDGFRNRNNDFEERFQRQQSNERKQQPKGLWNAENEKQQSVQQKNNNSNNNNGLIIANQSKPADYQEFDY